MVSRHTLFKTARDETAGHILKCLPVIPVTRFSKLLGTKRAIQEQERTSKAIRHTLFKTARDETAANRWGTTFIRGRHTLFKTARDETST